MKDYLLYVEDVGGTYMESGALFGESEKERAEIILKALDGTDIISARSILVKCAHALQQTEFRA